MRSDYLLCGSCFLEFKLSNIDDFIEHKKLRCELITPSPFGFSSGLSSDACTDILECFQCFRKFNTPWSLLLHVQQEHHIRVLSNFTENIPTVTSDRTANMSDFNDKNEEPFQNQLLHGNSYEKQQMSSASTQTIVGMFCTPKKKKSRVRNLSETLRSIRNTTPALPSNVFVREQSCNNIPECQPYALSEKELSGCCRVPTVKDIQQRSCCLCVCAKTLVDDPGKQSTLTNAGKPSASLSVNCCSVTTPSEASTCCSVDRDQQKSNAHSTLLKREQRFFPCCPCPPPKPPITTSAIGCQTDFDPEFPEIDINDMELFLTTPSFNANLEACALTPVQQNDVVRLANPETSYIKNTMAESGNSLPVEHNDLQLYETGCDGASFNSLLFPSPHSENPPVLSNDIYTGPNVSISSSATEIGATSDFQTNACIAPSSSPKTITSNIEKVHCTGTTSAETRSNNQGLPVVRSKDYFICRQCGHTYRQKVHLRKHVMSQHWLRKPYQCQHCAYATVEKSHLTVHIRTHTGERPFRCRVCDYSSAQNCTLKSHYLRRHPASRVVCPQCGEVFVTEQERNNHHRGCRDTTVPDAIISTPLALTITGVEGSGMVYGDQGGLFPSSEEKNSFC